jgi:XTP/dITP diphosphohydrolase
MGRLRARLASQNPHKLDELSKALPGWTVELLGAAEFPPETGGSYLDNARAKARFGREVAPPDEWVLGEDSGIEVAALDGAPGIRSARWAGGDHVTRVLEALRDVPDERRGARYVCELVAVAPDGDELRGRGELRGRIAVEARGDEGFGFDPVFVPDGEEHTVAELGDEWKRGHSHRSRAAGALLAALYASPAAAESSGGSGRLR